MATPRVANRYPRPGEPIAPRAMRDFLLEPLPSWACEEIGSADGLLADLDETAWQRFRPETIQRLSRLIVQRVAVHHIHLTFQRRRFPKLPAGIRLDDLRLENRTRRCLTRTGLDEDLALLADCTIGRILSVRAFGPRCLVDLLSALQARQTPGQAEDDQNVPNENAQTLSKSLSAAARHLAALPEADSARRDDPRFARLMQAIGPDGRTARELAGRLLSRTDDPPTPSVAAAHVSELARRIEEMSNLTLEDELIQVFASTPLERNRDILIAYYGWQDGRQRTLTEVGGQFGVTRERIRQVCAKLTKPRSSNPILAPVMDRALAQIHARLPRSAAELEAELARTGLTAIGMSLDSVATGAELLGRAVGFRIVKVDRERLAVRDAQVPAAAALADFTKKEVYFHGLSTVERIRRFVAQKFPDVVTHDLVRETVRLLDGFVWLDEPSGWFRLRSLAKHGLPKAIDKILAVAGSVTATQMREALGRNRRLWTDPPPKPVLLEFCRQTPGIRVDGDQIISDPPRDWRQCLTGVEKKLVQVLGEHGPVMERGAMEELCVADGMNRFSFHAFVSWSPVIAQYGHSLYGLLGAKVSPQQINDLLAARRAQRPIHRVLDRHGITEDGKIWLSYRLSKAASTYAVITIPSALKKAVRGKFQLVDPEGNRIGTLATRDGRAWGLGTFMRQRGAQVGDRVILTLDLEHRTATVSMGDQRRTARLESPLPVPEETGS